MHQELINLHYGFKYFLDKHNYDFVKLMMLQFDEKSDISELKIILNITKELKENEILKDGRERILKIFKSKIHDVF